jgi:hypothetical protein
MGDKPTTFDALSTDELTGLAALMEGTARVTGQVARQLAATVPAEPPAA